MHLAEALTAAKDLDVVQRVSTADDRVLASGEAEHHLSRCTLHRFQIAIGGADAGELVQIGTVRSDRHVLES